MGDLAFVVAGCCALAAIALIVVRLGSVRGNADWIYAWIALLLAGADLVLVPITSWLNVVSPLYDHLFATFLLSGTLRFTALERHLKTLWIVSCVVCLLRLTIQPFMPFITGALSATAVISISSGISFWLLFQDAQKESLPATRAMSFAFLAPGAVQLYFLISRLQGDVVTSALFAYVMMGSMLAMAQLTLLLERARKETERAHVQLGELIPKTESLETIKNIAANIAHVFNNKLTVISGNVELLTMGSVSKEESAEYIQHLNAAIEECTQVTQDFLLLTQEQPVQRKHVDLHQTIADLEATTSLQLSSGGDSATLDVDPSAFSRAFKELLKNSEEAGASQVRVDCSLTDDGFMQLKVKDNGRGLDGHETQRLFEPFFSMKEQPLGSGLGLSVVDSIVRAHGGKTNVSSLDRGVEISMTWPVAC